MKRFSIDLNENHILNMLKSVFQNAINNFPLTLVQIKLKYLNPR